MDGHFKTQDGGQVSHQYHFQIDPYNVTYGCQFWFTFCKYTQKFTSLGINGDHFKIHDGGQIPCM